MCVCSILNTSTQWLFCVTMSLDRISTDKLMQHGGCWHRKKVSEPQTCVTASSVQGNVGSVGTAGSVRLSGETRGDSQNLRQGNSFGEKDSRVFVCKCAAVTQLSLQPRVFFLSRRTLIALITLNCPPRSVDLSLALICLEPESTTFPEVWNWSRLLSAGSQSELLRLFSFLFLNPSLFFCLVQASRAASRNHKWLGYCFSDGRKKKSETLRFAH